MYSVVCVCVRVCEMEREGERDGGREKVVVCVTTIFNLVISQPPTFDTKCITYTGIKLLAMN